MNRATDSEENALELQFGNVNFRNLVCISNDEMWVLCKEKATTSRDSYLMSTMEFLDKIVTTKNEIQLASLSESFRIKLAEMKLNLRSEIDKQASLHVYEMNCLINFVDSNSSVQELLSLVPSLGRFREEDIEEAMTTVKEGKGQVTGGAF
jgi:hypothetical protein